MKIPFDRMTALNMPEETVFDLTYYAKLEPAHAIATAHNIVQHATEEKGLAVVSKDIMIQPTAEQWDMVHHNEIPEPVKKIIAHAIGEGLLDIGAISINVEDRNEELEPTMLHSEPEHIQYPNFRSIKFSGKILVATVIKK